MVRHQARRTGNITLYLGVKAFGCNFEHRSGCNKRDLPRSGKATSEICRDPGKLDHTRTQTPNRSALGAKVAAAERALRLCEGRTGGGARAGDLLCHNGRFTRDGSRRESFLHHPRHKPPSVGRQRLRSVICIKLQVIGSEYVHSFHQGWEFSGIRRHAAGMERNVRSGV
eukprot:3527024-Prymnesium_polylepis.1